MRALMALLLAGLLALPAAPASAEVIDTSRTSGPSRIATAVAVSRLSFPDGADAIILVRADAYADALAGGPLAAVTPAPVLLTGSDGLHAEVAAEIARLGARRAVLLGGEGALSQRVAEDLERHGVSDIDRISGSTRFETAARIAQDFRSDHVYVVEGAHADPARGWPDALAASALAAFHGDPILLVGGGALPAATRAALSGVRDVTVIGGEAAVPADVVEEIDALVPGTVERIAGATRYATSVAVAQRFVGTSRPTRLWVASGADWPDALVAGPAAARDDAPLVLVDGRAATGSPESLAWVDGHRGSLLSAQIVGGESSVSAEVVDAIANGSAPAQSPPPPTTATPVERYEPDGLPPALPARNPAPPVDGALPWSDPATWGGRVPAAGEVVHIPADRAVLLDTSPPPLAGLEIDGTLVFADAELVLDADWIVVRGRLAAGTEERPLTRDVRIVLDAQPGAAIGGAGAGPLLVDGGTLDLHGSGPLEAWTRLRETAPAGSTRILVEDTSGWRAGDVIVVASTDLEPEHAEQRVVTGVDAGALQLDRPLEHGHHGQTDVVDGRAVRQHAEVANLSRNVVVTSSDEAAARRHGGHIISYDGSVVRVSRAELSRLGQAGQMGRYPIHFHLGGSRAGSYVHGASVHSSFNRCVTIHGTSHVVVSDTVGFDSPGHCFFFEDAVEVGNALHCNLGLSTRAVTGVDALLPSDATPATFWVTNPDNALTDNVAAGSEGFGFWYDLPESPTGAHDDVDLDVRGLPLGRFSGNVAHSTSKTAFGTGSGLRVDDWRPVERGVFEGFLAYKNEGFGAWLESGDLVGAVLAENEVGYLGLHSSMRDSLVVGQTSNEGSGHAWSMAGAGFYSQPMDVSDTTFANFSASGRGPHAALAYLASDTMYTPEVERIRFVDAHRVWMEPEAGELRNVAFRDRDGTAVGSSALITGLAPLVSDGGCATRSEWAARVCPPDRRVGFLVVEDIGDRRDLGAVGIVRGDGVSGTLDVNAHGHGMSRGEGGLLLGHAYELRPGRGLSDHVVVQLAGREDGWAEVAVPWPHGTAHVYDGWGFVEVREPGTGPADVADGGRFWLSGGVLRLRVPIAAGEDLHHVEICRTERCG